MNEVAVNLYSRVEISKNDCWEFQGPRSVEGYGKFKALDETLAHRVSFRLSNCDFPKELCVLHRCDNPPCINPDHLFLGTRDINNKDRAAKGRTITPNMNLARCKRGHEFTEENAIIRKNGTRLCRQCNNEQTVRRYYEDSEKIKTGTKTVIHRTTHCPRGHEYVGENVGLSKNGIRFCRTCASERAKVYYRKKTGKI